jgi:hypothetical protein
VVELLTFAIFCNFLAPTWVQLGLLALFGYVGISIENSD